MLTQLPAPTTQLPLYGVNSPTVRPPSPSRPDLSALSNDLPEPYPLQATKHCSSSSPSLKRTYIYKQAYTYTSASWQIVPHNHSHRLCVSELTDPQTPTATRVRAGWSALGPPRVDVLRCDWLSPPLGSRDVATGRSGRAAGPGVSDNTGAPSSGCLLLRARPRDMVAAVQ